MFAAPGDPAAAAGTAAVSRRDWFVGIEPHHWRGALAVEAFAQTPPAAPPRNARVAEVGERFRWSATAIYAAAGFSRVDPNRDEEYLGIRLGLAIPDLWERSGSNSLLNPSSPPVVTTAAGAPGVAGGFDAGFVYRFGPNRLQIATEAMCELGAARLDAAPMFGGPPQDGALRWMRLEASLLLRWPLGRWQPYGGVRLVVTAITAEWALAFSAPPAQLDTDARFTQRWPLMAVAGTRYRGDGFQGGAEVAVGRWPSDVEVRVWLAFDATL